MSQYQTQVEQLRPEEYKALYEIGRVIIQLQESETALREIVRLARPAFIFDNIVLYELHEDQKLAPTYARSIGRGRSVGAEMDWGETIAYEVIHTQSTVVRCEEGESDSLTDADVRLNRRDFLGIPLEAQDEKSKVLVFIRFGGPPFLPKQIDFAHLIAELVEQLLERRHLVERVALLEADRRLARLQEHFVSTVSHELRSPLGFIKGYATTLLREDANWDAQTRREFLSIIDEETDRLTEIIDQILDSSRLQAGTLPMEFQDVRISSLLQDFAQRMQSGNLDIAILVDLKPSSNTIYADSARLVQVLDNLVNNAAKYAPGSDVTITLQWESDWALIVVSDTGPGIPDEHLEDIFKRFYRLPEHQDRATGTGLGLYICHEIVQAHGGRIYARSALGEGVDFHILLPRKRSNQQQEDKG